MTAPTVVAWHGDPDLKARTVERMRQHAAADRLIRGSYHESIGDQWQGCLHGCLVAEDIATEQNVLPGQVRLVDDDIYECEWHVETKARYGIDREVGDMLDRAYEGLDLPPGEVAVRLLEAIPVGADLSYLGGLIGEALDALCDADIPDEYVLAAVCGILAAAPIPEVSA